MRSDLNVTFAHVPFRCGRREQLFSAYSIFAADWFHDDLNLVAADIKGCPASCVAHMYVHTVNRNIHFGISWDNLWRVGVRDKVSYKGVRGGRGEGRMGRELMKDNIAILRGIEEVRQIRKVKWSHGPWLRWVYHMAIFKFWFCYSNFILKFSWIHLCLLCDLASISCLLSVFCLLWLSCLDSTLNVWLCIL